MKNGIWKYSEKLLPVGDKNTCSLNEGNTKLSQLSGVYIKREDLNPTGSYKDRGAAYRISVAKEKGETELVVTSTGNFAISMATYGKNFGINITVFVPQNISKEKEVILNSTGAVIIKTDKPVQQAKQYALEHNVSYVRQSLDLDVLEGFKTLMLEIFQGGMQYDNIIFPVSSGTLLLACFNAIKENNLIMPRLIAAQTTYNTYIARGFYNAYEKSLVPSIATSLNVKLRPEKLEEVLTAITKSDGTAITVSEQDIIKTQNFLSQNDLDLGYESSLAFYASQNMGLKGDTLVISTGVKR
jgi:threonine synthase